MQVNLKEFHKVLLEILLEFDRVCRENDIKYSLSYGTLLGAVRHKGFIPWDDDVDIMMTRDNFEKMCKVFPNKIRENYFFQSKETDKKYPYNIARLRKNNTAMIYDAWEDAGFHQGIYIDICPCDNVSDKKLKKFIQKWMIVFCTPVRISQNKILFTNGGKAFGKSLKKIVYYISRLLPKNFCDKSEYKAITCANKDKTNTIGIICEGGVLLKTPKDMIPFKREYLTDYTELEFEDHKFMVSANYKELLEWWYGDYMKLPPKEKQVMFHGPKYYSTEKSYEEYLLNRENVGK